MFGFFNKSAQNTPQTEQPDNVVTLAPSPTRPEEDPVRAARREQYEREQSEIRAVQQAQTERWLKEKGPLYVYGG